jgi:parallel beta-helix repeat protein
LHAWIELILQRMHSSILVELKKAVFLAFVLVLLSTAVAVRFIRPVEAGGTIYIRADGSIEGTTDISTVDNVTYTFTANIFNQSVVVERDNIVVDGAGYTLQGTGANFSIGIDLSNRDNVTVKAMQIGSFQFGLYLNSSSGNSIYGNTITNNSNIYLYSSSNNNITGNYVKNNWNGIALWPSSNHNIISGNNITNNEIGISLDWSSNNIISGNTITNNERNGIWLFASSNNIIYHNNFVNNTKQVYDFDWDYPHMFPSVNLWDDGAGKGNYWSDYEERYPNATELNGSGIWDTPYVIDEKNQDNYPIVPEFPAWTSMLLVLMVLTVAMVIYKRRLLKTPIH